MPPAESPVVFPVFYSPRDPLTEHLTDQPYHTQMTLCHIQWIRCISNRTPPVLELHYLQAGRFLENSATKRGTGKASCMMFNYCCEKYFTSLHRIAMHCIVFSRDRQNQQKHAWMAKYWISFCTWTNTYKLQFLSPVLLETNPHICVSLMKVKNQNKHDLQSGP